VDEGLALVVKTGERFWEAELHRIKGELLRERGETAEAEACMQRALQVARDQQARSLELRAGTSLARLWQNQGKRKEACDLLAPVYNWFTEGFDTKDLKEGKALLDELGEEAMPINLWGGDVCDIGDLAPEPTRLRSGLARLATRQQVDCDLRNRPIRLAGER
jgi:MalT-like TPR region